MKKLAEMNKNDIKKGQYVVSEFSGNCGRILLEPSDKNNILIIWDNGNDSYGNFLMYNQIYTITKTEYSQIKNS